MKNEKVESIIFNKGMKIVATDSEGALGGFLVIWKHNLKLDIIFNEANIFLIQFKNLKDQKRWFIMNIYAPNTKNGRRLYWNKMCNLMAKFGDPKGIIMGYFNTHLMATMKLGRLPLDLERR